MNIHIMRFTSRMMVAAMLSLLMPFAPANAALVTTDQAAASAASQDNRDRIRAFFDRKDVQVQLQNQGISADAAKARVDGLTDEEVQRVAGNLDKLPAGGEILEILLTVFIILLVTDILGFTKVFNFTKPIKK